MIVVDVHWNAQIVGACLSFLSVDGSCFYCDIILHDTGFSHARLTFPLKNTFYLFIYCLFFIYFI